MQWSEFLRLNRIVGRQRNLFFIRLTVVWSDRSVFFPHSFVFPFVRAIAVQIICFYGRPASGGALPAQSGQYYFRSMFSRCSVTINDSHYASNAINFTSGLVDVGALVDDPAKLSDPVILFSLFIWTIELLCNTLQFRSPNWRIINVSVNTSQPAALSIIYLFFKTNYCTLLVNIRLMFWSSMNVLFHKKRKKILFECSKLEIRPVVSGLKTAEQIFAVNIFLVDKYSHSNGRWRGKKKIDKENNCVDLWQLSTVLSTSFQKFGLQWGLACSRWHSRLVWKSRIDRIWKINAFFFLLLLFVEP